MRHDRGYDNACFEMGGDEGMYIVEEFYTEEAKSEQHRQTHDLTDIQDILKEL